MNDRDGLTMPSRRTSLEYAELIAERNAAIVALSLRAGEVVGALEVLYSAVLDFSKLRSDYRVRAATNGHLFLAAMEVAERALTAWRSAEPRKEVEDAREIEAR